MTTTLDENDRHMAGDLDSDPEAGTEVVQEGPRVETVRSLLRGALDSATKPRARRNLTTGNADLDSMTGGFAPKSVWVFGAETSWGKSSWLVAVADENLRRGARVLIVSTEDTPELYGKRLLARRANLDARKVRDGQLDAAEVRRASQEVERAEELPVYLDAIGKSAEWIAAQIVTLVRRHGISWVGVDYLQEIRSTDRHENRRLELAHIAGLLRSTIKSLGISGCLFSQLTLEPGERPGKYSVRDSKDVANGAEVVALGWTMSEDNGPLRKGDRVVLVDKNKDGAKGMVALNWDDRSACFLPALEPGGPPDDFSDLDAAEPPPHWAN